MFYRKGNVYERWVDGRFRFKIFRVRYVNILINNFFLFNVLKIIYISVCMEWKFFCWFKENNYVFLCVIFDIFLLYINEI